jgi:protein TonB
MFEDCLIISHNPPLGRRGWPAVVSFAIQALFVGTLIVIPMVFTDALPMHVLTIAEIPLAPRIKTQMVTVTEQEHRENIHPNPVILVLPSIHREIILVVDPPSAFNPTARDADKLPSMLQGVGGQEDSRISDVLNFGRTLAPSIAPSPGTRWRVSGGVERGLLIRDIQPIYPALARQIGVRGAVILQAIIGKDGRIENLHAISGNPLLVKAALAAVEQWRYRPYLLNGEPVEVETQITINFNLL